MGFFPDNDIYVALGLKFYYKFFYLNTQFPNLIYIAEPKLAILIGMEYPISKDFNLSGGIGYNSRDIPIAWEIGINYKIFK